VTLAVNDLERAFAFYREGLACAEAAGATLTRPAHERPWGLHSGYFSDLDGHLWEVIWNREHDDEATDDREGRDG
jgi:hypothetical protein